jgi:predicted enzyme related to lactoylglutathione lyase
MNKGIKIAIYPVKDIKNATATFRKFLGIDPYAEQPYYVGFKVNDQDIGLVPGNVEGVATAFYQVDDIQSSLQILIDGGASIVQDVKNVGGSRMIASAKDKDGNIIGMVQD